MKARVEMIPDRDDERESAILESLQAVKRLEMEGKLNPEMTDEEVIAVVIADLNEQRESAASAAASPGR